MKEKAKERIEIMDNLQMDTNMRISKIERGQAALKQEVKSGFKYIEKELKDIKNNHLHTLEEKMTTMQVKIATITTRQTIVLSIAVFIITMAVNLIFVIFFK